MLAMAVSLPLFAQAPPVQDPLMNLMLTQPRIDISTNVTATAVFEPAAIRPGEEAVYRVTLNALEESIAWPTSISTSPAAEIRAGAHGQVFQMGPGVLQPRTSFLYHIWPSEAGQLSVPAFDIKVGGQATTVPAATLDVTNDPPAGTAPAQRLALEMDATNLYAGQSVRARVSFSAPTGGPAQGLMQVQFAGEGFVVDQSAVRQRFEARPRAGGGNALTYIYETTLTPLTAGKLSVFGQGFTSGSRFSGTIVISGPGSLQLGPPQYLLLDSDSLELDVKPLPRKGELPGFTGAIGKFSLDAPTLEGNSLRVGDPVRLSVVVRSDNCAGRLVAPPPPNSPGWQIVASPDTAVSSAPLGNPQPRAPGIQVGQLPACATFNYTLIPLNEKETNTPAIPFSYFDPARGAYMDLTVPAVSVTISPAATADSQLLAKADSVEAPVEAEPGLSDLAAAPGLASNSLIPVQRRPWFPLVQAAPGAAFLGLWGWDRRRRYLEKHPDILLRRRARRALRRERHAMQQAARAGDACRFTTRAVEALRIACAPFYPAEPHALVGSDVLEQLPETGPMANSRTVVRRFFAAADAATFNANPTEAGALLAMQPEIEKVLSELEARLQP